MSGTRRGDRVRQPAGRVWGYEPNALKDEDGYISPHRRRMDPAWGLPPAPRKDAPRTDRPKRDAQGRFVK